MNADKDYCKDAYSKADEARIDALVNALVLRYNELTGKGKDDQKLYDDLYNVVRFR